MLMAGQNLSRRTTTTARKTRPGAGLPVALLLLVTAGSTAFAAEPPPEDDPGRAERAYRSMFDDPEWFNVPEASRVSSQQGFYAEWWAGGDAAGDQDGDLYAGLSRELGHGFAIDTGVAQYGLNADSDDPQEPVPYQEYYFGLTYERLEGKVWYTDDYEGSGFAKSYYQVGVSSELGEDFQLSARLGYSAFEEAAVGQENYTDYSLAAEKRNERGLGIGLRLMGTQREAVPGENDLRLMGTISHSFR